MKNKVHLIDCMEHMATVPDKFFDMAVVDRLMGWGFFKTIFSIPGKWFNEEYRMRIEK